MNLPKLEKFPDDLMGNSTLAAALEGNARLVRVFPFLNDKYNNKMNMDPKVVLKSALGQFFMYDEYDIAIRKLRNALSSQQYYKENWYNVIKLILNKQFVEGEPLKLIDTDANLSLYENSDAEALKWLNLLLINSMMEESDHVLDYKAFFQPTMDEKIPLFAVVVGKISPFRYIVQIENGAEIIATLSPKYVMHGVALSLGDKVLIGQPILSRDFQGRILTPTDLKQENWSGWTEDYLKPFTKPKK